MAESKVVDLSTVIGIYPISNTGAVLVYEIDQVDDRVLAGMNTDEPEWCPMEYRGKENEDDAESGFVLGSFFVPFSQVMRMDRE